MREKPDTVSDQELLVYFSHDLLLSLSLTQMLIKLSNFLITLILMWINLRYYTF